MTDESEKRKIQRKNHGKFVSKFMTEFHANRTPEQKAATSKKTSDSIKKWWANRKKEEIKESARKTSKSVQKRCAERPPRMVKDINKKKSETFRKFDQSLEGREHRKYLGYLSRQDILYCEPDKKCRIIKKRSDGLRRNWANMTPEDRERRLKNLRKAMAKRKEKRDLFYEEDVPRQKNYCGVVTEQELECMYG